MTESAPPTMSDLGPAPGTPHTGAYPNAVPSCTPISAHTQPGLRWGWPAPFSGFETSWCVMFGWKWRNLATTRRLRSKMLVPYPIPRRRNRQ